VAEQCGFFFAGVGADGGGSFTLLPGIEPSTAVLRFVTRYRLPQVGVLTIRQGSRSISFRNCRIVRSMLTGGDQGRWQEVTIVDRRWMWGDTVFRIHGEYNRPGSPTNTRTAFQLGQLLATAMQEIGYDVSALSRINTSIPVEWDGSNAASELDTICNRFGMYPTLTLADTMRVVIDGVGQGPQATPQAMDFTLSGEAPAIPQTIIFEGGQTLIQHDLRLKPVGEEVTGPNSGKLVLIDDLSYKPDLGWAREDPNGLRGFPTVLHDHPQAHNVCSQTVWKLYQVAGEFTLPQPPFGIRNRNITRALAEYFTVKQGDHWRVLPMLTKQMNDKPRQVLGYFALNNAPMINNSGHGTLIDVEADNPNVFKYDRMIDTIARAKPNLTYPGQFKFDETRGLIEFSEPVYFYDKTDGYLPAPIRLRTQCPLRDPDTAALLCQQYWLNTGSPYALPFTRNIKESEIGFEYITDGQSNQTDFTNAALARLSAELLSYQLEQGASVPYKGFYFDRFIDGVIRSITFDVSEEGAGTTHVDYNMERPEAYLTLRELRLRREVTYNLFVQNELKKKRQRGLIK
jgi:hypothetical protein